jgi:excisionase family DNA binding protein
MSVPAQPTDHLAPRARVAVERLAYSPAEAAQALGISRGKLYQLLDDGTLASVKLDRRRLIRTEAIVALLDSLEARGGDAA